jgi:hypothetical protein
VKSLSAIVLFASLLGPLGSSTAPTLNDFRYTREIQYPPPSAHDPSLYACAILDANVFAHSMPGLPDLRVFDPAGKVETPYAVTVSSTSAASDSARIVRISPAEPRQLTLDLEMPKRPYSQVDLSLNARNFVATAHVMGLASLAGTHPVFLGDMTIFDLTSQGLGANTVLPVAESIFPYLRVSLTFEPAPGNGALSITPATVASAQVPPARQAQTLYTGIAQSFRTVQRGQQTVATFAVPAHVPIERVSFSLDSAEGANFRRAVSVSASMGEAAPAETVTGEISRVHLAVGGMQIEQRSLSIPAILGANAQTAATVEVAIDNGLKPPLKIQSVQLEMRQRQLCFRPSGTLATLAYGSDTAQPPAYDFGRTFHASIPVRRATLLQEHPNALFVAPVSTRERFKRYPAFAGLSAILAISLLAVIAYRALHRGHRDSLRG